MCKVTKRELNFLLLAQRKFSSTAHNTFLRLSFLVCMLWWVSFLDNPDIYSWNMSSCKTMSEVLVRKLHKSSLFRDVQSGFSLGLRCLHSVFPRCTAHPQKDVKPCKQTNLMFQSTIFWYAEKFPFPFFESYVTEFFYLWFNREQKNLYFCIHFLLDCVVTLK